MDKARLVARPKVSGLPVPYMVDESNDPIDFKKLDPERVKRCATAKRCGICGGKIRQGPFAFIGPNTRDCFAEPWMHPDCGEIAMQYCPFLSGKKSSPRYDDNPLVSHYAGNMRLVLAESGEAHRDDLGHWHFKAINLLEAA